MYREVLDALHPVPPIAASCVTTVQYQNRKMTLESSLVLFHCLPVLHLFFLAYIFVWLHQDLAVAHGIFALPRGTRGLSVAALEHLVNGHVRCSSLSRDQTQVPCIGSLEC